MLPGGLVDGGKETEDFVLVGPVIKKMSESTSDTNNYNTEPEIKNRIHRIIISLMVYDAGGLW